MGFVLCGRLATILTAVVVTALLPNVGHAATASGSLVTFFGEDLNNNGGALTTHPNSDRARADLFSNLKGVGTETFEGIATGTSNPTISFPGAGTATLVGTGVVSEGLSSSDQYPISGTHYYNAGTETFAITFSSPIAAFGFYGTDFGDVSAQATLTLTKSDGSTILITVPNAVGGSDTDGSALYFGFYDKAIQYTSITFGSTVAQNGDVFGFDDFSVGATQQVVPASTVDTSHGDLAPDVFSLGSAAAQASTVVFDGGTLRMQGGNFPGNIVAAPVLIDATSGTVDTSTGNGGFSGVVSGPGSLTVTGGGRFSLTNANTYAGGTALLAGTLVLGNSTALGTGLLSMDDGTSLGFAAGDLDVGNAIAFTGTDPVIDTGSFNETLSGPISGPGSLTKLGSGTLDLTGTSTYTGATTVSAGTLLVDGAINSSAVTVQAGAALGGGGSIGALVVQSGAVVTPTAGQSLRVVGAATFAAGSTYQVLINSDGTNARLTADSASLGGARLSILQGAGTFGAASYTLLTTANGVSGTFGSITTGGTLALLDPTVSYGADDVVLTLHPVAFASLAQTPNQAAAAAAIQALGPTSPLYQAVLQLDAGSAPGAYAAASGITHADMPGIVTTTARLTTSLILDRLWDLGGNGLSARQVLDQFSPDGGLPALVRCYGPVPDPVPAVTPRSYTAWGEGFGSFGHTDANANAGSLDRSLGGFILGIDTPFDNALGSRWRAGVAGGYTNTTFKSSLDGGSGTVQSVFGSLYGGARYGAVDIRLGATAGGTFTDAQRSVAFPGFLETEKSSNDGYTVQGFGEVGYRFASARGVVEPVAGAAILHIHAGSFSETGGAAALDVAAFDQDLGTTSLGVRGEVSPIRDVPLVARGLLAWQHVIGAVAPATAVAFEAAPTTSFSISGAPIDRDALAAEAALDYRASAVLDVGLSYTGLVGGTAADHSVKGRMEYRF